MGLQLENSYSSLEAIRHFNNAMERYQTSQQKLSTGKKIIRTADDPSGSSVANILTSQALSLEKARANSDNAINFLQVADSALAEMSKILQTIKSKANEASSDLLSLSSKNMIENDIKSLLKELVSIEQNTSFGGSKLLNGLFADKKINVGAYAGESINLSIESAKIKDIISTSLATISTRNLANTTSAVASNVQTITNENLKIVFENNEQDPTVVNVDSSEFKFDGTTSTIDSIIDAINAKSDIEMFTYQNIESEESFTLTTAEVTTGAEHTATNIYINGITISAGAARVAADATLTATQVAEALVANINAKTSKTGVTATNNEAIVTLKTKEKGGSICVDAKDSVAGSFLDTTNLGTTHFRSSLGGEIQLVSKNSITILKDGTTEFSDENYGNKATIALGNIETKTLDDITINTINDAQITMVMSDFALESLNEKRAIIGVTQKSLETMSNCVLVTKNNVLAAASNMTDIDFAEETLNFSNLSTLVQTSAYALTQAKTMSQIILTLLK